MKTARQALHGRMIITFLRAEPLNYVFLPKTMPERAFFDLHTIFESMNIFFCQLNIWLLFQCCTALAFINFFADVDSAEISEPMQTLESIFNGSYLKG